MIEFVNPTANVNTIVTDNNSSMGYIFPKIKTASRYKVTFYNILIYLNCVLSIRHFLYFSLTFTLVKA